MTDVIDQVSPEECVTSGHLEDCDSDGFCNGCGEQDLCFQVRSKPFVSSCDCPDCRVFNDENNVNGECDGND